jgi:hypothetical protein
MELDRRALLRSMGAACAFTLARPVAPASAGSPRSRALAHRLLEVFPDTESARAIGAEYLAAWPEERDLSALLENLLESPAGDEVQADCDVDAWTRTLAARTKQDFEWLRVVKVDGWVLSRSEARLCALAVLA